MIKMTYVMKMNDFGMSLFKHDPSFDIEIISKVEDGSFEGGYHVKVTEERDEGAE